MSKDPTPLRPGAGRRDGAASGIIGRRHDSNRMDIPAVFDTMYPTMISKAPAVIAALRKTIEDPCLDSARALEDAIRHAGAQSVVFGRMNQKSSVEAASDSDRGATERLANAFDASLKACRSILSEAPSKTLTPRAAAKRYLNGGDDSAVWQPTNTLLQGVDMPEVEFWAETETKQRFRKHNPSDGLATMAIRDRGVGLEREETVQTILALNSASKLRDFEAIGQFGHGGSSALQFCESCLIITGPRAGSMSDLFWTLIVIEKDPEDSKQALVRKWFAEADGFPMIGLLSDQPALKGALPGTIVYHFGYHRSQWIKRITGPEQSSPWGRLGRMFFSYPLPFRVVGVMARGDEGTQREIVGAYYRLVRQLQKPANDRAVEYRRPVTQEQLVVEGVAYGHFQMTAFVLRDKESVRDYVDRHHPVILTLHGQNHGEMTSTLMKDAGYPELAACTIVEIRLDGLEDEALGAIINNSREMPKMTSPFTKALSARAVEILREDAELRALEVARQEQKAKKASRALGEEMQKFLTSILSEAAGQPGRGQVQGPGEPPLDGPSEPLPQVPAADPPQVFEFLSAEPLHVPEGVRRTARIRSDARPPRYTFHGDNPRCFARVDDTSPRVRSRISIGFTDINERGYARVAVTILEDPNDRITSEMVAGTLVAVLQTTDGRVLATRRPLLVVPKPIPQEGHRQPGVKPVISFYAPDGSDMAALKELWVLEDEIEPLQKSTHLCEAQEHLKLELTEVSYHSAKGQQDGMDLLNVDVNAGNSEAVELLRNCPTVEKRVAAKNIYMKDVVLDCYQHHFKVKEVPKTVLDALAADASTLRFCAECQLNHDKALRLAFAYTRATPNQSPTA